MPENAKVEKQDNLANWKKESAIGAITAFVNRLGQFPFVEQWQLDKKGLFTRNGKGEFVSVPPGGAPPGVNENVYLCFHIPESADGSEERRTIKCSEVALMHAPDAEKAARSEEFTHAITAFQQELERRLGLSAYQTDIRLHNEKKVTSMGFPTPSIGIFQAVYQPGEQPGAGTLYIGIDPVLQARYSAIARGSKHKLAKAISSLAKRSISWDARYHHGEQKKNLEAFMGTIRSQFDYKETERVYGI